MELQAQENINLLIVDDNADNCMLMEASLEQDGLNIFTTRSPKQALQICIDNDISMALVDIHMPEMDGFELLRLLKKDPLTENIIIILITGYSRNSEEVVKGLNLGAVDYLFKPLDLHITNAKVNSLITLVNYQREINKKNRELESYQGELFKAIKQIEKSKVIKENFLANMSHEIRTPLNAIVGLSSLLLDSSLTEDQEEMVGLMEYSSRSLLGIVNDILESAQIDAGKIKIKRSETNVKKIVQAVSELSTPMATEKGLKLICEIGPEIPEIIMADALRLNQILINLINNAIKFTERGVINISLRQIEKQAGNVLLEFTVKDSGVGIPESSIDKLFTRFEQIEDKTWQKYGGTGLGLSIVKRLVELKGGTLKVESTVGVGTSFIFTNTFKEVLEPENVNSLKQQISALPKFDDVFILLAEDNATNQYIATKMLREWNVKVDIAANGIEAFEKLTKNMYDLLLMDTHMPLMDGNEATRKIRKELTGDKKDIPIVAFSASVLEREKNEAWDAGADDFIEKPFEPMLLNSKIHKLLDDKNRVALSIQLN